jgi:hypothetical protein
MAIFVFPAPVANNVVRIFGGLKILFRQRLKAVA